MEGINKSQGRAARLDAAMNGKRQVANGAPRLNAMGNRVVEAGDGKLPVARAGVARVPITERNVDRCNKDGPRKQNAQKDRRLYLVWQKTISEHQMQKDQD